MTRIPRIISFLAVLAVTSQPVQGQAESGWASWYNGGFHGEVTASGEAYDHEAMTAAHPSLPLGSEVRVTRTDTGRSVTVRVNDRMTAEPNHVIDVSGGAARRLGLLESGIALVRIEPMNPSPVVQTLPTEPSAREGITLQLGVFANRQAAAQLASEHVDTWIQSVETTDGPRFRVYYREFASESAARTEMARLRGAGHDAFLRWL